VAFAWQNPTQNPPGGGGSFVIESGAPVNTIYIKADGKVGIGTSTPGAKLDVVGGMIKIPKATDTDNGSPGLVYVANDDFLFNGYYINHYGFGFHSPDSGTPGYTGAYMSGYYGLDLFTGGISRMHVLNNGNIGINTVSPTTYLDARGNSQAMSASNNGIFNIFSTDAMAIDKGGSIALGGQTNTDVFTTFGKIIGFKENVTAGNTAGFLAFGTRPNGGTINERMRITSAGNVGIGTTAPGYKLEIGALSGAVEPTSLKISGGASNGTQIRIGNDYSTSVGTLYSGANGFLASNSYQTTLGVNSWSKNAPTYASTIAILGINATLTQPAFQIKYSPGNTPTGAFSSFFTNDLLTVLGNGNVGIGTTSPQAKLQIVSTDSDNTVLSFYDSTRNQGLGILVNKALTGSWPPVVENTTMTLQSSGGSAGNLAFATGNTERMRIAAGGNVGIGTISPSSKLTVEGTFSVSGNANICNLVSYTGGGGTTQCPAGFYTWSGVALTSGYMLCCKVSNPI